MKKLTCLVLLSLGLLLVFTIPAWADNIYDYNRYIDAGSYDGSLIMSHLYPHFLLDGEVKTGDVPRLVNGRLLMPLRQVSEAFKAKVDWDDKTQKATVTVLGNDQKERTVRCGVGNDYLEANGVKIALDVPAQIYDGRIYLPLRALGEALGKYVDYENQYKLAVVSDLDHRDYAHTYHPSLFSYYNPFSAWIALQGWPAVYGDNFLAAYKKSDDLVYLRVNYGYGPDSERVLDESNGYISSDQNDELSYQHSQGYQFVQAPSGAYLVFRTYEEMGSSSINIYSYKDKKIALTSFSQYHLADFQIHGDYIYVLTTEDGLDFRTHVHEDRSNLLRLGLTDGKEEYLGLPGWVYGWIYGWSDEPNFVFSGSIIRDWQVKDDGIYISGFDYFTPGLPKDLGYSQAVNNILGNYRVSLTPGGGHEQLPD